MLTMYNTLRPMFSADVKEQAKPYVDKMVELATISQKEGILALDDAMEKESNTLLKLSISLVTDGTSPITVKRIMQANIIAGNYTGIELLSRLIIAEGVVAIRECESPQLTAIRLNSMLGEEYTLNSHLSLWRDRQRGLFCTLKEKTLMDLLKEDRYLLLPPRANCKINNMFECKK